MPKKTKFEDIVFAAPLAFAGEKQTEIARLMTDRNLSAIPELSADAKNYILGVYDEGGSFRTMYERIFDVLHDLAGIEKAVKEAFVSQQRISYLMETDDWKEYYEGYSAKKKEAAIAASL